MYEVLEHRDVEKALSKAPIQVKKSYVAWKRIVELQGPHGLREIKGFHDETLKGRWLGFRSSRLNQKWRVIYKDEKQECTVYVIDVNPHVY